MAAWDKNAGGCWPTWSDNKLFTTLLAVVLLSVIAFTVTAASKNVRESRSVGFSDLAAPTIQVSASGEASTVPDIAMVDIAISVTAATADAAQDENATKMNALLAAIKALGIEERDLTSSYAIYPQYDYDVSPAVISGYQAEHTVAVKIRQSDLVSTVLQTAGDMGATSISSLRYEIDDDTAVTAEAREEAIEKAREQAETIASAMGVRLGGIASYSESSSSSGPTYYGSAREMMADAAPAPDVQAGENEVEISVNITYAIVQ